MDLKQFMPDPQFLVGVDLAQRVDFTAVSVLERHLAPTGDMEPGSRRDGDEWRDVARIPVRTEYALRHLERSRDRPYPEIVEYLVDLVLALEEDAGVIADATGVGLGVCDYLWRSLAEALAGGEQRVTKAAVQIHGGAKTTRPSRGVYNVPKRELANVAQVLLESRRLKVAAGLELKDVLLDELRNFRAKIDPKTAHDSYSHFREGDHDDLVLSVALAAWFGERRMRKQDHVEVPNYIPGYLAGSAPNAWGL